MAESKGDTSVDISVGTSLPVKGNVQEVESDTALLKERKCVCKICVIDFSNFPSLKDHINSSHIVKITKNSYFCHGCEETFQYLTSFQTHLHRAHTAEKIGACIKCGFNLPQERIVPTRSSGDTFSDHYCVVCQVEMKAKKRKMKEDDRNKSDGKKKAPLGVEDSKQTGCEIPKKRKMKEDDGNKSDGKKKAPLGVEDSKQTGCEIPKKRKMKEDDGNKSDGKKKAPLGVEDNKQTGCEIPKKRKTFFCDACQKGFKCRSSLQRHLFPKHGLRNKDKPFRCNICQDGFSTKGWLELHLRKHVETKSHACEVCDQAFSSIKQLQKHSLVHGSSKLRCEVCLKELSSCYMPTHMRIHQGIKPHACTNCDMKFVSRYQLKEHLLTHTDERPHSCEICEKKFARRKHLRTHLLVHTGEKPYVCDVCNRGFNQKWVMVAHRRIHTGERPFECDICLKGFIYNSQLKKHRMTHVKDNPSD